MATDTPAFRIPRRPVFQPAGEAGLWAKVFDPPTASPDTPDRVEPTNPVPEVMAAAGFLNNVPKPHTVALNLMHGMRIPTWDNRPGGLFYGLFRFNGNPLAQGNFPGATIRIPRGVVFHGDAQGHGPPPHTVHWHGIEPTGINDGVGHCSMEIGRYTYQFQPNFMGTYFYHCHRNTVQHFEFGMHGGLIVDPPLAFFDTLNFGAPIGKVRNPADPTLFEFRAEANLGPTPANPAGFPQFPGWRGGEVVTNTAFPDALNMTVPYDVEAIWLTQARDSVWSDNAQNVRAFLGRVGNQPGVNDRFARGFFNDYNADYWFVTGVPVPAPPGGVGVVDPANTDPAIGGLPGGVIPAGLNSGVEGTQVAINAGVNQTVLLRVINGAYNHARYTFPVDVVIIAFDGRSLGVPPFGNYHFPFLLPAGTPIILSTARRFQCLIRSAVPVNSFATVEFFDTQANPFAPGVPGRAIGPLLVTAQIPIVLSGPAA